MAAAAVGGAVVVGADVNRDGIPDALQQGRQSLPPPATIEKEKVAYCAALQKQLAKQSDATNAEADIQKKMIAQTAQTQLAQYALQIDEQLKMSMMEVDRAAQMQLAGLQEAAITQQTSVEERAALAAMEYKKKAAIEQMSIKSYQAQKSYYDQEMALAAQYQQVMKKGYQAGVVTSPVPTMPMGAGI